MKKTLGILTSSDDKKVPNKITPFNDPSPSLRMETERNLITAQNHQTNEPLVVVES